MKLHFPKGFFRKYGILRVMFTAFTMMPRGSSKNTDELHLEYLSVLETERGQGVGTALLHYGLQMAKENEKINRYSLGVIGQNTKAKKLYEQFGFKAKKICKSSIRTRLTGVRQHYYMVYYL